MESVAQISFRYGPTERLKTAFHSIVTPWPCLSEDFRNVDGCRRTDHPEAGRAPAPPPATHLRLALAAAPALPRADRGAVRLRGAFPQGTGAPRFAHDELHRAGDHAGRPRFDRRGDDLEPAD